MEYKPVKHRFTKTDLNRINKIGYQVQGIGTISFPVFMNKYFPNFNLVSLLQIVENKFTPTTQAPITRSIDFDDAVGVLRIDYRNQFLNEDDALLFVREFVNKNGIIEIKHEYCVIPKSSRNNGLIKPVFQESLQQYVNINAKRILVHAGLSGGGYTWAKHGFVAMDKNEVDFILSSAKSILNKVDFNVVKKIYDIYYTKNPKGASFPMDLWASFDFMKPILRGSNWHGEIDLKNKEQFRNFKDYVSR